jgi:hypothetical protein
MGRVGEGGRIRGGGMMKVMGWMSVAFLELGLKRLRDELRMRSILFVYSCQECKLSLRNQVIKCFQEGEVVKWVLVISMNKFVLFLLAGFNSQAVGVLILGTKPQKHFHCRLVLVRCRYL